MKQIRYMVLDTETDLLVDDCTSPMITYDLTHHGLNHCGSVHSISGVMEHKIHATKRDLLNSFLTDKD